MIWLGDKCTEPSDKDNMGPPWERLTAPPQAHKIKKTYDMTQYDFVDNRTNEYMTIAEVAAKYKIDGNFAGNKLTFDLEAKEFVTKGSSGGLVFCYRIEDVKRLFEEPDFSKMISVAQIAEIAMMTTHQASEHCRKSPELAIGLFTRNGKRGLYYKIEILDVIMSSPEYKALRRKIRANIYRGKSKKHTGEVLAQVAARCAACM